MVFWLVIISGCKACRKFHHNIPSTHDDMKVDIFNWLVAGNKWCGARRSDHKDQELADFIHFQNFGFYSLEVQQFAPEKFSHPPQKNKGTSSNHLALLFHQPGFPLKKRGIPLAPQIEVRKLWDHFSGVSIFNLWLETTPLPGPWCYKPLGPKSNYPPDNQRRPKNRPPLKTDISPVIFDGWKMIHFLLKWSLLLGYST